MVDSVFGPNSAMGIQKHSGITLPENQSEGWLPVNEQLALAPQRPTSRSYLCHVTTKRIVICSYIQRQFVCSQVGYPTW